MRYCAAFVIWVVAGLSPVAGQVKKPAIVFDSIIKNAGTITQGEIAKQVFTYTNKGTAPLEIISVHPT
jgi:hypothetical protein